MSGLTVISIPQVCATTSDFLATPVLMAVLVWLCIIDSREFRLPDAGTLPLVALGLILAGWRVQAVPWDALIGALSAFALFAGIGAIYFRARGVDGLGLGDAKLLAASGAWLGWQAVPTIVLIASLSGIAIAYLNKNRAEAHIAFGPAIAAAFALHWLVFLGRAI